MSSSVPSPVIVARDAMFLKMLSEPYPTDSSRYISGLRSYH